MNRKKLINTTFYFGLDSENVTDNNRPEDFIFKQKEPNKNFVVGRDNNLSTVSVYGDLQWDWTAYSPFSNQFILDFTLWCDSKPNAKELALIGEMQWIIFMIVWLSKGRRKSPGTVALYLRLAGKLAQFSLGKSITIKELLQDKTLIVKFLDVYGEFYATQLNSLINILVTLKEDVTGIKLLPSKCRALIADRSKKYYTSHNQHPPIPTRILSNILGYLSEVIAEFNDISKEFLLLASELGVNNKIGNDRRDQHRIFRKEGYADTVFKGRYFPSFDEVVKKYSINEYLLKYSINTKKQLFVHMKDIQVCIQITLLAYSGMRHMELSNLQYDCYESFVHGNQKHHLVEGRTTKLNHGRAKRVKWVVSSDAAFAVSVAVKIADCIYKSLGFFSDTPEQVKSLLLTPNPSYLTRINRNRYENNPKYYSSVGNPHSLLTVIRNGASRAVLKNLLIPILEEDILELEAVDFHRDWRGDPKFRVGSYWSLSAHQFRRSLALYATNSGLVKLPSLRRQLKQITDEMGMYYANGSSFAKDIFDVDSDFVEEYRTTIPESEAVSYITNVILSDEQLFGAHGSWVTSTRTRGDNVFLEDREETLKKFKKGQIRYQETILGGCTGTNPCQERALRSVVACTKCSGGVIELPKLNRVIKSQQALVKTLDPGTLLHRTESNDLKELMAVRRRIKSNKVEV